MVVGLLADVDPLGVAPRELEDVLGDEVVVEQDVGALHHLQRAQREQARVARAAADQVHHAGGRLVRVRGLRGAIAQHALERLYGLRLAAGEHHLRDRALHHVFPEAAARVGLRVASFGGGAKARGERGEPTIGEGQQRFDQHAQLARQHRRCARSRDRDLQRRAVDDRRHDERRQGGVVGDIHRDTQRARGGGHGFVYRRIVGRGDGDLGADQVAGLEALRLVAQRADQGELGEPRAKLGRDHRDLRPRAQQRFRLERGNRSAADDDAALAAQVEKGGKVVAVGGGCNALGHPQFLHMDQDPRVRPGSRL